jgi:hypothetical protein
MARLVSASEKYTSHCPRSSTPIVRQRVLVALSRVIALPRSVMSAHSSWPWRQSFGNRRGNAKVLSSSELTDSLSILAWVDE